VDYNEEGSHEATFLRRHGMQAWYVRVCWVFGVTDLSPDSKPGCLSALSLGDADSMAVRLSDQLFDTALWIEASMT